MKKEFIEEEAIESMIKFVRPLRENAKLAIRPMSAHIRIAYDTYLNLQNDELELEYLGHGKSMSVSISQSFKKSKYMTDQKIKKAIEELIKYVGSSPTI